MSWLFTGKEAGKTKPKGDEGHVVKMLNEEAFEVLSICVSQ
jgi:hypothetical protein